MRNKLPPRLVALDALVAAASLSFVSLLFFLSSAEPIGLGRFFLCLALLFLLHLPSRLLWIGLSAHARLMLCEPISAALFILLSHLTVGYPPEAALLTEAILILSSLTLRLAMQNRRGKIPADFDVDKLLFREPIDLSGDGTASYYESKTVFVTGGGGSIGSELCRQVAKCSPRRLIIFDVYENNAYELEQELRSIYRDTLSLTVEIGSVRDRERLDALFAKYRPDVVFHAAAHKHVPLMEQSAGEAIKNNVIGTYNVADVAEKYGVKKFILISTDKAVNPTNVMGGSKRICEMIVQCRADSATEFSAVRFGNVLGSNGSVIPLFRRQIESGGPVTITDRRIVRFFMTVGEAAQLVMQAGVMAKNGELFVLNMGKPIRILDLAEGVIRMMGLTPYRDIEIKEIGLRPGEKLYEEPYAEGENLVRTHSDRIFVVQGEPISRLEVEDKLAALSRVAQKDRSEVRRVMAELIPEFKKQENEN